MVASRRHDSFQDYLSVEEMSGVRHEYVRGEIIAMAGGTPEHAALSAAILVLLGRHLAGTPCRPYSSDLRLRILATGLATYPDAAVICGDVERDPESSTHATNPRVIVEVLSPSTADYDRGEKREHYQQLESLREYVLIEQERRAVEVYVRATAEGPWSHVVQTAGGHIELASLALRFSVDELYDAADVCRRLDR